MSETTSDGNLADSASMAFVVSASALSDDALRALIEEHAPEALVRVAWNTAQAVEYTKGALAGGATRVIAVGGDGTVNAVVQACVGSAASIGVIPRGTANDFAFALGLLELEPAAHFEIATGSSTRAVDVVRVGDSLCINALSIGDGARITHETSGALKGVLGALGYAVAGVAEIGSVSAFGASLRGDFGEWEGDAFMIVVGNGTRAGGVRVHPHAEIDDGVMDVVVFPDVPDASLLGLAGDVPKLERGTFEHLEVFETARLEVKLSTKVPATLDGEFQELSSVSVELLPGALRVAAPPVQEG